MQSSYASGAQLKIHIRNGATLEEIVGPMQSQTEQLIAVEDGRRVVFFVYKKDIPEGLSFIGKQRCNGITEYYFKSRDDRTYCVFDASSALLFSENSDISPGLLEEEGKWINANEQIKEIPSIIVDSGLSRLLEIPKKNVSSDATTSISVTNYASSTKRYIREIKREVG